MAHPPEYLEPLLETIESATYQVHKTHPQLVDKEVEKTYTQLKEFFQKLAQGKELYEPTSTLKARQALIEALIDGIDLREEERLDEHLVNNPEYQPGGRPFANLEQVYATAFNYLRKSVRLWHKEGGRKGYLNFIGGFFSE